MSRQAPQGRSGDPRGRRQKTWPRGPWRAGRGRPAVMGCIRRPDVDRGALPWRQLARHAAGSCPWRVRIAPVSWMVDRTSPCPSRMAPVRPGAVAVAPLTRARRWSPGARVPAAADRGLRGSGVWRSRRAEVPGRSRFAVGGRCVLGWTTRGRLSVRARAWTAGIRGRLAAQTERPGAAVGRRLRRPGGWQVVKPAQSGCGPLSERQADGGGSPISTMTIAVVTECIKSQALQCRRPDRWRFADPFPGKGTLFPGLTRPHAGLRA